MCFWPEFRDPAVGEEAGTARPGWPAIMMAGADHIRVADI
jgi:hypothetical protein